MAKNKAKKFKENETFAALFQPSIEELRESGFRLKGMWRSHFFKNENPIVLELGCGRGEYSLALAKLYPDKNFVGVDIKGARIWRGAKTVTEEKIDNVAFIRNRIENVKYFFGEGEVDEIWITFPDPQPRNSRRRLTSPPFLELYRSFLKEGAIINVKSDSLFLHTYTKELVIQNGLKLIESNLDIYGSGRADQLLSIETFFESLSLEQGAKITYLAFTIDGRNKLVEPVWDEKSYKKEFKAPPLSRRIQ